MRNNKCYKHKVEFLFGQIIEGIVYVVKECKRCNNIIVLKAKDPDKKEK